MSNLTTHPTQHPHICYTYFILMLILNRPILWLYISEEQSTSFSLQVYNFLNQNLLTYLKSILSRI